MRNESIALNVSHNARRRFNCSESVYINKFALTIRFVLFDVNLVEEKGSYLFLRTETAVVMSYLQVVSTPAVN